MREVHPDLVGTPRFEGAGEEAGQRLSVWSRKTLQYLPVGNRLPAVPTNGLLVAGMGVAPEWGIDRTLWTIRCTPNQGQIAPLERAIGLFGELLRQGAMSPVVLATTIRPVVSLSRRWTIPGRLTPPMPDRLAPQCAMSAFTSVPVAWPAAG